MGSSIEKKRLMVTDVKYINQEEKYKRAKGNYKNKDAVEKTINYITRNGKHMDRASELRSYGGRGVITDSPEDIITGMKKVQQVYDIDRHESRRIYHEYYLLDDKDFEGMGKDFDTVDRFAYACAGYLYKKGFQVAYAVHQSENLHTHIHFVVNPINVKTGKKLQSYFYDIETRQGVYDEMAKEFYTNSPILSTAFQYL